VNWNYTIPSSSYGWWAGFSWYQGGTQLAIPLFNSSTSSAGINLNALTADTKYNYTVSVSNCGGSATKSGTFTTLGAPTNEFVGWVFHQQPGGNPYELNPVGGPVPSANVLVGAECWVSYPYAPDWASFVVNFSATAGSSGYYQTSVFPLSVNWTAPEGQVTNLILSTSGLCTSTGPGGIKSYYHNSVLNLTAASNHNTYIWETREVPASLSETRDYQQFILPFDTTTNMPVALALLHTSYAQCGFSYTTSFTYTINSYMAGSGYTDLNSTGQTYQSPNVTWGQDTGMELSFTTTGVVSDTLENFAEAWALGVASGSNQYVYTTSEWLPNPPAWNGTYVPIPYQAIVASPSQGKSSPEPHGFFDGGSFSSTTGVEMDVEVGIDISLVSFGASAPLSWTISQGTTTYTESTCYFYNPGSDPAGGSGGQALFYYAFTGAPFGTQTQVIHVWFMGYCGGSNDKYYCP
jgi:hypothetical protein